MDSRVGITEGVRSVNISLGRHLTSEEELLSFPELHNYESSNSSRKTTSEFIDERMLCNVKHVKQSYIHCKEFKSHIILIIPVI